MSKYTVEEYAELKGVSKQAIYQRIKRKTLNVTVEDGITYIESGVDKMEEPIQAKPTSEPTLLNEIQKSHKREVKILKKIIKRLEQDIELCRSTKDKNYERLLQLYELAIPKQLEYKKDAIDTEIIKKKKKKKKK